MKRYFIEPSHPRAGWVYITADNYSKKMSSIQLLCDDARSFVPDLTDEDIEVVIFNNRFRKGCVGIMFRCDENPDENEFIKGDYGDNYLESLF